MFEAAYWKRSNAIAHKFIERGPIVGLIQIKFSLDRFTGSGVRCLQLATVSGQQKFSGDAPSFLNPFKEKSAVRGRGNVRESNFRRETVNQFVSHPSQL